VRWLQDIVKLFMRISTASIEILEMIKGVVLTDPAGLSRSPVRIIFDSFNQIRYYQFRQSPTLIPREIPVCEDGG